MNVIVSNLNSNRFVNLDIDVIKSITGEFTVDEIIQSFSNFFFNRMFLDITSIKDYHNINNMKALAIGLDISKVILYIGNDVSITENYISKLISFGIYNFAKTEDELKYLYDNPNSYKDVAHLQKIEENVSMNVNSNINVTLNNVSDNKEVITNKTKVIGFKNVTSHAGATSLIYMLKKELSKSYYTVAIEINKRDFMFFNDKDMVSCKGNELSNLLLKYGNYNLVLVDLNDLDDLIASNLCTEIVYLFESSTLMINKLVMLDKNCFNRLSNKKVILNRSMLSSKDVSQLEFESGIHFVGVLPPMNDRVDNSKVLMPLLSKLGFYQKVN